MIRKLILAALLVFPCWLSAVEKVNINTASAEVMAEMIKGVGESKAEAIVAFRTANGPFASVDDLALIKGIGEKTVDKNRSLLTVGSPNRP